MVCADLSTCQLKVVNDKKKDLNLKGNNNLVGGKGSADIIGIPAGGKSEGCNEGDECMAVRMELVRKWSLCVNLIEACEPCMQIVSCL